MTTRKQRARLPRPEEIGALFDEAAIVRLAGIGRVPKEKTRKFGRALRASVGLYVESARQPDPRDVREEIAGFAKVLEKAIVGSDRSLRAARSAMERLSSAAREVIGCNGASTVEFGASIPSGGSWEQRLQSMNVSRDDLLWLYGLCGRGTRLVKVKHIAYKRSRSRLRLEYAGPNVEANRPMNVNEFVLCASVAQAYLEATGREPTRYPNQGNRGPFVTLVANVLKIIWGPGVGDYVADQLVRKYANYAIALEEKPKSQFYQ